MLLSSKISRINSEFRNNTKAGLKTRAATSLKPSAYAYGIDINIFGERSLRTMPPANFRNQKIHESRHDISLMLKKTNKYLFSFFEYFS